MGGIRITNSKSKMPKALKLASSIASFLFEEQYRECEYMKADEIEAIKKVQKILIEASNRAVKK